MSDQHTPAIVPPGDAPLPWSQDADFPAEIVDADNIVIGEFFEHDKAAYAVLAANALPGLVGLLERHGRMDIDPHGTEAEWSQWRRDVAAALAALPGEVRGS